jgi:menaquinone-specific isochorismate synthase
MVTGRFFLEISPGEILCGWGPWAAAPEGCEWKIAVLPFKPLGDIRPRFLGATRWEILTREQLARTGIPGVPPPLQWSSSPPADFSRAFQDLQHLIRRGQAHKGVPFAWSQAPCADAVRLWEGFVSLVANIPAHLLVYGAQGDDEAVIGASPEWLFRIEGDKRVLHTMAVAATRWPGQERAANIDEKEHVEHRLVVDDIVARLRPFGTVTTGATAWAPAGKLEHLKTAITLHAHTDLDAAKMLQVLHPTPAMGVFPRTAEAQNWLDTLPGHEIRADFAAPWVVEHRDGRAWALVAIRQIRMRPDHLWIPAGCGVVAASEEEAEWNEIHAKIRTVKETWALA